MTPLILLAVPAILVMATFSWTLGPLLRAARETKSPSRFLLSDLAWLMVQLQFALGVMIYTFPASLESHVRIWGMVLVTLPVVLFWTASLHLVSQARIVRPLRRAAVFVVLLPGMTATVIAIPVLATGLLASLGNPEATQSNGPGSQTLAVLLAAAAAFALALGWLSRWAVAEPPLT